MTGADLDPGLSANFRYTTSTDMTTHSTAAVNVAVERLDPASGRPRADVIVAAGTRLPFSSSSDYTTQGPNQATVPVKLLQRPGGLDASSDPYLYRPLLHATLRLPPGLANGSPLQITTTIDAAGRLTLRATYQDGSGKVCECEPDGLLGSIVCIDVVRVTDPVSIFISYSHDDKELALALYEGLKKSRGHRVWLDERELRIGDSLIESISTAIAEIDFFLALVSPAAAHSSWCQKELALAVSGELNRKGMRVMPLRVDGADMPAALGDQLYLDVSLNDVGDAIERLLRDIASYRADAE